VAGKRVKAFKKRHDDEPDAGIGSDDDESDNDTDRTDGGIIIEIYASAGFLRKEFWRIPMDARLGGGGCREGNRPGIETEDFVGFGRVG
jgi:hypothetical protein